MGSKAHAAKATTRGLLKIGKHVFKTWSTTRNSIALSSGEQQFYALAKAGSQGLGRQFSEVHEAFVANRLRIVTFTFDKPSGSKH